jgi:hypothetical protein
VAVERTPEELIMAAAQRAARPASAPAEDEALRALVDGHPRDARAAYDWAVRCSLYAATNADRGDWANVALVIASAVAAAGVQVRARWATVPAPAEPAGRTAVLTRDQLWDDWR